MHTLDHELHSATSVFTPTSTTYSFTSLWHFLLCGVIYNINNGCITVAVAMEFCLLIYQHDLLGQIKLRSSKDKQAKGPGDFEYFCSLNDFPND